MERRRLLLGAIWFGAAAVLGAALLVAQSKSGPLDDPDPAHQRPGFLDALGPPFPAPAVTDRLPSGEGRTVVFFTRPELAAPLARSLGRPWGLAADARAVVVLSGPAPPDATFEVPVVEDPEGRLAADFAMPRPKDGGPPAGYALVAMFPDFLFAAGIAHQRWMDIFLGHLSTHFVPGRNATWYAVFLASLAVYLPVLDRRTGDPAR